MGKAKLERKRDCLTTLYIRLPARADSEGALARFALVADGGSLVQPAVTQRLLSVRKHRRRVARPRITTLPTG